MKHLLILIFIVLNTISIAEIKWKEKKNLPLSIRNGSAAACNNKIYFMGGYCDSTTERYENKNFEYDISNNIWIERASLPTGRSNFTLVEYENHIYAIGGDPFSGKNEAYNTKTNTWTELAPLPTPRQHVYGTELNGKIYIIGGLMQYNNSGSPSQWSYKNISTKNEVYDIAANTWETKSPMPIPTHDTRAACVNGKIYVIGGMGDTSSIWKTLPYVQMYDPDIDKWEMKQNMPEPRDGYGMCVINNKIYIIGGFNSEAVVNSVLVYDPVYDSWITTTDFPNIQNGAAGAVVIDNTIFIIGGCDNKYQAYDNNIAGEVENP